MEMTPFEAFIYFMSEGLYLLYHWPWAILTFIVMSPFYIINFGTWIIAVLLPRTDDDEFDSLIILNGFYKIAGNEG